MNEQTQMSESFRTAVALALTGGFLETYTFLLHGHVFANAQTGNIALCGISVATGQWMSAARYAVPILSFAAGVAGVEWVRGHWTLPRIHWRQSVVIVEATLLCGCFFLKGGLQDMLANLLVSIACALQVQTFRKVRGSSYASTMCTGNLRAATVAWLTWRKTHLPNARHQALHYFGVIGVFLIGAASAVPLVQAWEEPSIAVPIGLLLMSSLLMFSGSSW